MIISIFRGGVSFINGKPIVLTCMLVYYNLMVVVYVEN